MNPTPIRQQSLHGRLALPCLLVLGGVVSVGHAQSFSLPFSTSSQTPHPAVVRITVPEQGATSHGSGTLVNVAGQHGLVVTNWHVIREAAGEIMVDFPDGFRSAARVVKIDQDWDLAALQIWRPNAMPIPLAATPPRPGDPLSIAGYGSGTYRLMTGRCTQYVAPGADLPYEMVELSAEARQGDSGGPIFNQRGELAGVLFGASQGTTSGSYSGRVGVFLASILSRAAAGADQPVAGSNPPQPPAAAVEGQPESSAVAEGGDPPRQRDLDPLPPVSPDATAERGFARVQPYLGASPRVTPRFSPPVDLSPPTDVSTFSAPVVRSGSRIGEEAWEAADVADPLRSPSRNSTTAPWEELVGTTPLEQGKSILAGIGILAVLMRLSNVLAGGRN